jgi:hypothetical protein
MRIRELIAGALLTLLAVIQTSAGNLIDTECLNGSCPNPEEGMKRVPERLPTVSVPEPSALVKNDGVLSAAYYDTMKILGGSNRCSAFYGGPQDAVGVFGNFMERVRKDYLPASVGLKMSGDYINVLNARTLAKYRLFEKASVNSGGPFYRQKSAIGATISGVGSFPPGSREARVLMLLHELGHLMRGADGKWLLPDDGNSMSDSFKNTRKIESVCGDQIRALNKQEVGLEMARRNNMEQTVSPAALTSSHQ